MKVYLDNAATTAIDPLVAEAMMPFLSEKFGNPSSTHSHGREVKASIELARKGIAERLNCMPGEIYFTSGGTESINSITSSAIKDLKRQNTITSPLEHHAVLHTLEHSASLGNSNLTMLGVSNKGDVSLDQLAENLHENKGSLVSLMFANNEIGNVNDVETIASLCKENDAFFMSDTVQAMGHIPIDLSKTQFDAVVCSAHKIHGPKGVGFMFLRKGHKLHSYLLGGGQERNMRGGTENVMGIVGLSKAFEIAVDELQNQHETILSLKNRMIDKLRNRIPNVMFNGRSDEQDSLSTVLNVCFPTPSNNEMLLFQLDLAGISASGGSACNSGAQQGSHVLGALNVPSEHTSVRFSFSKYNNSEEVDYVVDKVSEILETSA